MIISLHPLPFLYGLELQLGGVVEISPRALVVLKPPLYTKIHESDVYFLTQTHNALLSTLGCTLSPTLPLRPESHGKPFLAVYTADDITLNFLNAHMACQY